MRYFVTGASGWIGSAVVAELIEAGHEVVGLARSQASAERVRALGADVHRGELDDLESLVAGAAASDGVVHLGYNHDFSRMGEAARTDLAAITAIGGALEGTDRPLLIASGTLGLATGRVATEEDSADPSSHPRIAGAQAALGFAERGVRSIVTRFAPTVHGPGDPGFVAVLVAKARETGVAGYVGDGANRWPAVHRLDAARLVRLAMEGAPAGSVIHATAEEGIPALQIAEAIGQALGIATASVAPEHFDWLGPFFAADVPASSARTRELLGWEPTHPGLLEDIPNYVG
ncbi:SDR family oxidoreductase [Solirubrobacter taibaiensis]|nr:SDR family oxidoreductase [Solirubrobacter taibaiensis]